MSRPHFLPAAIPERDPLTDTPGWMLTHPRLSFAVMRQIDHTIHQLYERSPAMGQHVEMLLPSEARRIPRGKETPDQARARPPRLRELCDIEIEVFATLHVDARRPEWRDLAADELQSLAGELTHLAGCLRVDEREPRSPETGRPQGEQSALRAAGGGG